MLGLPCASAGPDSASANETMHSRFTAPTRSLAGRHRACDRRRRVPRPATIRTSRRPKQISDKTTFQYSHSTLKQDGQAASIYKIDSLVLTEIEMCEVSKRSVFIGRMKLKEAILATLAAPKLDDLVATRLQRFSDASGGRLAVGHGVKFDQTDLPVICDVEEDGGFGGSLHAH